MTTETIPFTLADYQQKVVTDQTHELITKEENPARIVCQNRLNADGESLVVLVRHGKEETVRNYYFNGGYYNDTTDDRDLVLRPVAAKSLGWINIYNYLPATKAEAEEAAKNYGTQPLFTLEVFSDGTTRY